MSGQLAIVIVGASGDLAQRKILPALFSLFAQKLLPPDFHVVGFARTPMTDEAFRARTAEKLTCRYTPEPHACEALMRQFLARCCYVSGDYGSRDAFLDLAMRLKQLAGSLGGARLFYLAIPPAIFVTTARTLGDTGLVTCDAMDPDWMRVVIEKPFGRDRATSDQLAAELGRVFTDEQTYRIDHYLGKEVLQNLLVLRFANRVFEPLWNRHYVRDVHIVWKEDIGIGARAGYFDGYGIVRDVMQNHLMQMLALTAMEPPAAFEAQAIRDEKVRVLRHVPPLRPEELVLGQYAAAERGAGGRPAYRAEPGIPPDSRTATYAAAVLRVESERWRGVPFFVECGKALDGALAAIRLRFRDVPVNLFGGVMPRLPPNELVIRVQPDEAIFYRIVNKVPGLDLRLEATELNLRYRTAFPEVIPEAYESLLLDVIKGDKSLFIRNDELAAAWDIFDAALHAADASSAAPEPYPCGSGGPAGRARLAAQHGLEGALSA